MTHRGPFQTLPFCDSVILCDPPASFILIELLPCMDSMEVLSDARRKHTFLPQTGFLVIWGLVFQRKRSGWTWAFSAARARLSCMWGRWTPTLPSSGRIWVNTHMHCCPFHLKQNHWLQWAPLRPSVSTENSLASFFCGPQTAGVRSRAPNFPAGLLLWPFALKRGI